MLRALSSKIYSAALFQIKELEAHFWSKYIMSDTEAEQAHDGGDEIVVSDSGSHSR